MVASFRTNTTTKNQKTAFHGSGEKLCAEHIQSAARKLAPTKDIKDLCRFDGSKGHVFCLINLLINFQIGYEFETKLKVTKVEIIIFPNTVSTIYDRFNAGSGFRASSGDINKRQFF